MKKITLILMALLGFAFGQSTAGVQIIHNAADPAAATVDIYVNGNLAIDDFAFRSATPFLPLPAGVNLSVDVAPGNSTNVNQSLANFNLGSLTANTNYVVMANGVLDPTQFDQSVNSNIGFDLKILAPFDTFANALNQVSYRTYHGVTDAPAIDIFNGPWIQLGPLSYGNYYFRDQTVPALNYKLDVRVAGNGPVVTTLDADFRGLENQVPVVFASGFLNPANNQNGAGIGFFAALSNGDVVPINMANPVASVQIVHNAPDPAAALVDIYVNGNLALEDFAFRTATPFIPLPANTPLNIGVAPANGNIIATIPAGSLAAGERYIIMATGVLDPSSFDTTANGSAIGFGLEVFAPAQDGSGSINTAILAYHGAPDAPAVDVRTGGNNLVPNISYTDYAGYLQVPAANYVLEVAPAGGNAIAAFQADLSGRSGKAGLVFASGFLNPAANQNGPAFGLFYVGSGGTVIPLPPVNLNPTANVQIVHNAPDPAAALVDIYVNGNLALEDFAFRTATPFIPLPANTPINVGVAPANGNILATIPLGSLTANDNYVVMATGVLNPSMFDTTANGSSIGFGLEVFTPAQTGSGSADVALLAYHGAPDAPAVDVRTGGNNLVPNISYSNYAGYIQVPAANYVLDVAPAGGTTIASFQADLSGLSGEAGVVFASGFLDPTANQNGAAFGLFYVGSDGNVLTLPPVVSAPMMAKVQVIHNAPDPAANTVDIYINGARALNDFTFRDATPFIDLHAGQMIDIGVAGGNSNSVADTIKNFRVGPLVAGQAYVVMAAGVLDPSNFDQSVNGSAIAFDLKILANARTESANGRQVDYMAFHGSPDAPAVDVFNGPWIQLGPLSYGNYFRRYQVQPALRYKLDIKVAGTNTIATTIDADLRGLEGLAPIVFASGFLNPAANQNGPAFGFFAALPNGDVAPLPAIPSHMRTGFGADQGITVSPNPAISRVVIDLDNDLSSVAQQINLVDMQGRVLRTKFTNGDLSYGMDLNGIASGIYMIQVRTADRTVNQKLTVQ